MATVRERRRARAEQVLDREYDELRSGTIRALRAKLGASGASFDETDLEAFYNQAWHGLYLRLAEGEDIGNHTGFLVNASYFRAIEELRRVHPERRADAVDLAVIGTEVDVDALLDDHRQLTQFMEGMRDRLTERERQAATLCYIHGCTRPQTAQALGVSPKRMEKLMDGVSRKIGVLVADIRDGSWCESRDSLMKAYAFGVLDPDGERWKLASDHLRECPGCRRYVRGLRGVGAVAPPVGLPIALLALLGGGAAGGAAAASSAAGGGAGGGGGSGAGAAGGGAASSGSGIGAAGAAVAATAVVAAAGLGVFAVVRDDDKQQSPPPQRAVPAAPASATPSQPAASSPSRAKAKPKKAKEKASAQSGDESPAGAQPAPVPADSAANTPAAQPSAPQTTPVAPPAEEEPTTDGEQEFGFER
jgi:DNA-directed RNA polymerase specialized sigma24 family protein